MTEMSITEVPITAELIEPWFNDHAEFVKYITEHSTTINNSANPLRERLLKKELIKSIPIAITIPELQAVDSANAQVMVGDLASILVQGVLYSTARKNIKTCNYRKTGPNDEAFRHLAPGLRQLAEIRLIHDVSDLTILDNSFWSLLMDANKTITAYHKLPENSGKELFDNVVDTLYNKGLFVKAIANYNVVAVSKTATSKSISKNQNYSDLFKFPVSDRALMSKVLQPGEYLIPQRLSIMTDGNFGIENREFSSTDRSKIEHIYKESLGVLFYRPWAHQRAYRIEAHFSLLDDHDSLVALLGAIKESTQIHGIMEPEPQFLADLLAKSVSTIAELYGPNNLFRVVGEDSVFNRSSEI